MDFPSSLDTDTRVRMERMVEKSFVAGFRAVILVGAFLAGAGAVTAWSLIAGRKGDC